MCVWGGVSVGVCVCGWGRSWRLEELYAARGEWESGLCVSVGDVG